MHVDNDGVLNLGWAELIDTGVECTCNDCGCGASGPWECYCYRVPEGRHESSCPMTREAEWVVVPC